ncbi:hypothetical protein [Pseudonocardia sp.]|jgi:hypothetical protein|uniref:hypothetical protein n=1 Tax=Pseudonocardia sp. TaxID=60912 RepID=UPI0031FBAA13
MANSSMGRGHDRWRERDAGHPLNRSSERRRLHAGHQMLATKCDDTLITTDARQRRADELIAELPTRAVLATVT